MRTLFGISLAAALLTAAIVIPGTAPAAAHRATKCTLTTHDQRHLGASYVTSLSVKGTSCAAGKNVTLAFNRCRTSGGKPQGECNRKVGNYTCTEKRYDAVPGVQYSSKVTCVWGAKRVFSTYTQNT
ncbi:MAG TPA: hypothetical protein VMT37_12545 [Solirubrobacterales bacterium]|nr:hypothetical protein [Solirubrobacterales bacterium]